MSLHTAEVFRVNEISPWPNSDKLDMIRFLGYETAVTRGSFQVGDRAVFIQPDTLVPVSNPRFSFLEPSSDGYARVKAKRIRGHVSQGLVVTPPEDGTWSIGADVWSYWNLRHHEPEEIKPSVPGFSWFNAEEEGPYDLDTGPTKYDIENVERYPNLFNRGELVELAEKVDGMNARFTFWQGRFWVKSRNRWVKRVPDPASRESLQAQGLSSEQIEIVLDGVSQKKTPVNLLWQLLEANERLMKYLQDHEGLVVFGEGWGRIGKLKYTPSGNAFSIFDVYQDSRWLDRTEWDDIPLQYSVPEVARVHYTLDAVKRFASGPSRVTALPPFREGVVIKPLKGRIAYFNRGHHGRLILKAKNPDYHAR